MAVTGTTPIKEHTHARKHASTHACPLIHIRNCLRPTVCLKYCVLLSTSFEDSLQNCFDRSFSLPILLNQEKLFYSLSIVHKHSVAVKQRDHIARVISILLEIKCVLLEIILRSPIISCSASHNECSTETIS